MSCRPRTSSLWLIVLAACVTAVAIAADAQQTIPHQLASGGTSLKFGRFSTGRPPSIDMVLSHTDAIIRGTIAVQKRSYLSDDQQEVLTDYEIYNPELLYPATPGTPPLSVVVVTLPGGTVTINGLSYTLTDDSLPELPAARECLLLLKREGQKYRVALGYYGAFSIVDDRLQRLTTKERFAPEYHNAPADRAAAEFVIKLKTLRANSATVTQPGR